MRFQPYAATAALAVSEPVIEWVQVPPFRTLTAKRDTKDLLKITVTVEGAVATRSARDPGGSTPSLIAAWLHAPLMRMRVVRLWPDGREAPCRLVDSGFAEREDVPLTQEELERILNLRDEGLGRRLGLAIRPKAAGPRLRWHYTFALHEDMLQLLDGVQLAVVVEEVHAMRPAANAEEQHRRTPPNVDPEVLAVTGPRFAASVVIA